MIDTVSFLVVFCFPMVILLVHLPSVVFMDEAGLPEEGHESLKVSFIATQTISGHWCNVQ